MSADEKYREEIDWWEQILSPENRADWMKAAIDPELRASQFPPRLAEAIAERATAAPANVLDVGSGPLSPLASAVDQGTIAVTAVDPLADRYQDLLSKYGIDYPVKPMRCRGEDIDRRFGEAAFDVVYSRNALDHSDDPPRCIKNMVSVLKPHGVLYLEGFVLEGSTNRWEGLHQWDFSLREADLFCANRHDETVNMTAGLSLVCLFESGPDRNRWFRLMYEKSG